MNKITNLSGRFTYNQYEIEKGETLSLTTGKISPDTLEKLRTLGDVLYTCNNQCIEFKANRTFTAWIAENGRLSFY